MERRTLKIDLMKLIKYVLKRAWLIVLCAELGFGAFYIYTTRFIPDTYTATGTMYVNNGSPNIVNYQYTNTNDLDTAVQLIDTYRIVVKSNKVMSAVTKQLQEKYPGIPTEYISASLGLSSVSDTGVVAVRSTTEEAQLSADIVNAVLDVVPAEIIRVVEAGSIEIIDYAAAPLLPDYRSGPRRGVLGGMAGAVAAGCVLLVLFMLDSKITNVDELTENYTPPVLASIQRIKAVDSTADSFLLNDSSPMEVIESYAKLRMNLLYTLVGKDSHSVIVASAVSGEGKSTIAANLAISCATGGRKVLLVDGDLRRASQRDIFKYNSHNEGLSEILVGKSKWQDVILKGVRDNLDILPAGHFPPNPAELLESEEMLRLLKELELEYELILLDMPPINIVADPLVLTTNVAGCLFVTRQDYSDHREIRKALIAIEMTGMNILGFVFYGEDLKPGGYYNRKYYKNYYNGYDRHRIVSDSIDKTGNDKTNEANK